MFAPTTKSYWAPVDGTMKPGLSGSSAGRTVPPVDSYGTAGIDDGLVGGPVSVFNGDDG